MPLVTWKTTTIAGTLCRFSFKVPVPCPPVDAPHELQVISVIVIDPLVQPIFKLVGRTCGVDPGPHERTDGCATVVVVVASVVVVAFVVVVATPTVSDDFLAGEDLDPTANPMTVPTPNAARIRTRTPTRMTVLRRIVMTRGSLSTTEGNGTSRRSRNDEWPFVCRLGMPQPRALFELDVARSLAILRVGRGSGRRRPSPSCRPSLLPARTMEASASIVNTGKG